MWWNNVTGTIPHELSELSDSLEVLNMGGGSLTGTIPDSLRKLTKLEWMIFHDNCLTGTIPAYLGGDLPTVAAFDKEVDDSTPPVLDLLSSLTVLSLHNNANLEGSLNGFCNGTDLFDGFITLSGDCGCPMDVEGPDDGSPVYTGGAFSVDCDCCQCFDPHTFVLCDRQQNSWKSHFLDEVIPNGYPKSFDRETCNLSDKSWE